MAIAERLKKLSYTELDDDQKTYWNSLLASPRGKSSVDQHGHLAGPFDLFLRSPRTGAAVVALGEQLRYGTAMPQRLLELAILIVAAHWNAKVEWAIHAPLALKAGLDPAIVQSLKRGCRPELKDAQGEAAVYDVVTALLRTGRMDDETYVRCERVLGPRTLVDLSAVAGYYTLLAFGMGMFAVQAAPRADDGELARLDG
jgi:4-carboxymuconolactone decarboxylase